MLYVYTYFIIFDIIGAATKPAANTAAKPVAKKESTEKASKPSNNKEEKKERKVDAAVEEGGKENARGGAGHRPGKSGDKRHGAKPKGDNAEGNARPKKREFERHSGTGRGRELSKGGRGPFGFGNAQQDSQQAEKDPASAEPEVDAADEDEAEGNEDAAEEAEPEKHVSLKDYLATKSQARTEAQVTLAKSQARSVDAKELAGLRKHEDNLTDFMPNVYSKESKEKAKVQRAEAASKVVDLGFKVVATDSFEGDARRERSPRPNSVGGGRGGGRGDRSSPREGGRGGRGGRNVTKALAGLDISDKNAFPAL